MGCDIHSFVEIKEEAGWLRIADDWCNERDYSIFAFLADVRNYSHVKPISEPRGLPEDISNGVLTEYEIAKDWVHTPTYLNLSELLDYDYDQIFWDRRISKQLGDKLWTGAGLAEEGEGRHISLKEFLGDYFFNELENLKEFGDPEEIRIIFWFDN